MCCENFIPHHEKETKVFKGSKTAHLKKKPHAAAECCDRPCQTHKHDYPDDSENGAKGLRKRVRHVLVHITKNNDQRSTEATHFFAML
jgi:hypothetical protein